VLGYMRYRYRDLIRIDWAKMNAGNLYNLKPDNSEWFWILLGFDQLLHHLT
jgi:hypothetical protein